MRQSLESARDERTRPRARPSMRGFREPFRQAAPSPGMSPTRTIGPLLGPAHDRKQPLMSGETMRWIEAMCASVHCMKR